MALMSCADAARECGKSEVFIRTAIREKKLKAERCGKRPWIIQRIDFERFKKKYLLA